MKNEDLQVADEYKVDPKDFKKLPKDVLKGGQGTVTFVEQLSTGRKCVLKQTNEALKKNGFYFEREVQTLASVHHPAIVPFVGCCIVTEKKKKKGNIYLEAIEKGSLQDVIDKKDELWDETHKLIIAYGIACAMEYIHSKNVVHRDLKPENILLDNELQPYVTDFGTARDVDADLSVSHTVTQTTPYIMAPEFFDNFVQNNRKPPIDVYSYAMILYCMFAEEKPYGDKPTVTYVVERTMQNKRPEFKSDYPSQAWRDLIDKCWAQDPAERPTFTQICDDLESEAFHTPDINYDLFRAYKEKTRLSLGKPNSEPKARLAGNRLQSPAPHAAPPKSVQPKGSKNIKLTLKEQNNVPELKKAADNGDSNAQNLYALLLYNGFNVTQDQQEACRYFELAAKSGNYEAMLWYSLILKNQGNEDQASQYYQQAMSSGVVPECWSIYAQEQIQQGNKDAALQYLPQAIQYGSRSAMLTYAGICEEGSEMQDIFYEMASNCCHCLDTAGTYFPIDYKVYHCVNCNLDMCEGCAKHCHKNCNTVEVETRQTFVCGCGKNHFHDRQNKKKCSVEFVGEGLADGQPVLYQHLYQCKDCTPMLDGKFICRSCIENCHAGHNIVDCGIQRGFCHCGTRKLGPSFNCKNNYYLDPPAGQCTNKNNTSSLQRWYQCMTCGLYGSRDVGFCQNCAEHCHAGHIVLDRGVVKNTCKCKTYDKCTLKK